jgi:hypothetical protein
VMKEQECESISNGVVAMCDICELVFDPQNSVCKGGGGTYNSIQHTRLGVWPVRLVGTNGMHGIESRRVMDLVRCRHVEEVEFESEGWNLKAKVGSLRNKPSSPTNYESVRQFPCAKHKR